MKKLIGVIAMLSLLFSSSISVFADNHGEPNITKLETQFQSLFELETEENSWKVISFESAAELETAFYGIMSAELADYYLEQYFKLQEDMYYLLPQDAPAYIDFDQEYQLEKINPGHYQLKQEREDALRGEYTLSINYKYGEGEWMMVDRNNVVGVEDGDDGDDGEEVGGELPNTATTYPLWTLSGLLLFTAGAVLVTRKRPFDANK